MTNVETTSSQTQMASHKYRLLIKGFGGEFMIGSIPMEAAKYWHQRDQEELSAYVDFPDGSEFEPADEAHRLPHWHELDHFAHEHGIEEIHLLTVEDAAGHMVLELDDEALESRGVIKDVEFKERRDINDTEDGIIFSRTREKGYCSYLIETAKPFDINKLCLNRIDVWDYVMISEILYDGVRVEFEEGFDRDYADFEAFITGV